MANYHFSAKICLFLVNMHFRISDSCFAAKKAVRTVVYTVHYLFSVRYTFYSSRKFQQYTAPTATAATTTAVTFHVFWNDVTSHSSSHFLRVELLIDCSAVHLLNAGN